MSSYPSIQPLHRPSVNVPNWSNLLNLDRNGNDRLGSRDVTAPVWPIFGDFEDAGSMPQLFLDFSKVYLEKTLLLAVWILSGPSDVVVQCCKVNQRGWEQNSTIYHHIILCPIFTWKKHDMIYMFFLDTAEFLVCENQLWRVWCVEWRVKNIQKPPCLETTEPWKSENSQTLLPGESLRMSWIMWAWLASLEARCSWNFGYRKTPTSIYLI